MTQTAITLLDLFKQTPPDYSAIDEIMSKTSFSSDELTFLASEIIIDCDCDDPRLTGEPIKIKYDKLTYLYKSLEYLFSKGLDPNHEYDVYSPLSDFQCITTPGMGPKCMKLFLDHGANPDFLGEGEAETLFDFLEYKVLFDEDYLGNMDVFYCWFLLLIYGAKGRKLKFYGNHNIEDLNEYKALDYKFRSYDITNGNKTVGPLVIFFKETGEEIAELL